MCMLNQSKSKCQSPPIPCWPRSLRPVCCQVKSNKTPFPLGGDTFTIALQFTPISMSCFYISIFLYITLLAFVFELLSQLPHNLHLNFHIVECWFWGIFLLNSKSEIVFKNWNLIRLPSPLAQFTPEHSYFHTCLYFFILLFFYFWICNLELLYLCCLHNCSWTFLFTFLCCYIFAFLHFHFVVAFLYFCIRARIDLTDAQQVI